MPPKISPAPTQKEKVTPAQLIARIEERKVQIEALRSLYEYAFPPECTVDDRQFRTWLGLFDFDTIVEAFELGEKTMNRWLDKNIEKDRDSLASYLSGTMWNLHEKLTGVPRRKK